MPKMNMPSGACYLHRQEIKATALYTSGCVASELGRQDEAVQYYLEAEQAGKDEGDYQLLYLITSNLGGIYGRLCWNDSTLSVYNRALKYARLSKCKSSMAIAESYIGRAYSLKEKWEVADSCYNRAIGELQGTDDLSILSSILNEWAGISIYLHNFDLTRGCFRLLDSIPDTYKEREMTTEPAKGPTRFTVKGFTTLKQISQEAVFQIPHGDVYKSIKSVGDVYELTYRVSNIPISNFYQTDSPNCGYYSNPIYGGWLRNIDRAYVQNIDDSGRIALLCSS